jgi:hypothetical protein
VGFVVGGRRRRSYSSIYSYEDGGVGIWRARGCSPADMPQSFGHVAYNGLDQFIGSISSIDCEGVSPDLGLVAAPLCSRWRFGGSGNRRWRMVWRGVKDSKDHRVFLPLSGSFSLFFMTPICMVFRFVIVVTLLFNEMWLFSKRKKNLNLKTVVTRD